MGRNAGVDLTGNRIGALTVVRLCDWHENGSRVWECRCDCGNNCTIKARILLRRRPQKSCGCRRNIEGRKNGATKHPLYKRWKGMMSRCYRETHHRYPRYGGRGIRVARRWHNFWNFVADMGEPPAPDASIDRIDNNKGYSPANCRWASPKEQARNTSCYSEVTYDGITGSRAEVARTLGIPYSTLCYRLRQASRARR